jgi:hypothetical protein
MARIEYELYAVVGKYQGKDGKDHQKLRHVGDIVLHPSTGDRYIQLDACFNFSTVMRKEGSDRIFLKCIIPGG